VCLDSKRIHNGQLDLRAKRQEKARANSSIRQISQRKVFLDCYCMIVFSSEKREKCKQIESKAQLLEAAAIA